MRKIIAALLTVFVLSGCTSGGGTATETPTASAPSATPSNPDELFLSVIHEEYPQFAGGAADADMIALAHSTCDALDAGASMDAVMDAAIQSVGNKEDARLVGFVMGVGIAAYCPEHQHLLTGTSV